MRMYRHLVPLLLCFFTALPVFAGDSGWIDSPSTATPVAESFAAKEDRSDAVQAPSPEQINLPRVSASSQPSDSNSYYTGSAKKKSWGQRLGSGLKKTVVAVGALAVVGALAAGAVCQQYSYQQGQYNQQMQANRMLLGQEANMQAQTNYFNAASAQIQQQPLQAFMAPRAPQSWTYTPAVFGGGGTFRPGAY